MGIQLLPESSVQSLTAGLKVRAETVLDEIAFTVAKEDYRTLCERLFNAGFDFPSSMTGVDMEWGLGVVLHLQQLESKRKAAVRVYMGYDDVHLPTVSDLWGGMDWHEREAYDLVGLHFDGHHDHRRILLEDHWTIHPLQRKYNTRGYVIPQWTAKPWPVPAPWEEGYAPFGGAATAAAVHAPAKAITPPGAAPASSPATPESVAKETKAANEDGAPVSPVTTSEAASSEPPKKVAKKWVPKSAAPETSSAPSSDDTAVIAASVAEAAPSVAAEVNPSTPPVPPVSSANEPVPSSEAAPATSIALAPATSSEAPATEAPSTEASATEEKPRNPKIKRWNPNG